MLFPDTLTVIDTHLGIYCVLGCMKSGRNITHSIIMCCWVSPWKNEQNSISIHTYPLHKNWISGKYVLVGTSFNRRKFLDANVCFLNLLRIQTSDEHRIKSPSTHYYFRTLCHPKWIRILIKYDIFFVRFSSHVLAVPLDLCQFSMGTLIWCSADVF